MIEEGNRVLILDNSGNRRVLKIHKAKYFLTLMTPLLRKIKHFKAQIDVTPLLGKPFGSHFAIKDTKTGELEQILDPHELTKNFFLD